MPGHTGVLAAAVVPGDADAAPVAPAVDPSLLSDPPVTLEPTLLARAVTVGFPRAELARIVSTFPRTVTSCVMMARCCSRLVTARRETLPITTSTTTLLRAVTATRTA